MPTKLGIFNESLRILGQTLLTTPDAQVESARQLRDAWDSVVPACYEIAPWKFLTTRAVLARSVDTPVFGWDYYYDLPGDYVRTVQISPTGRPDDDLTDFDIEKGKVATNAGALYLRYISSDLMTLAPGDWTQAFADLVGATLAIRTAPKLNPSALEAASQMEARYRTTALSTDAIKSPPPRRQKGSLARAVTLGNRLSEQG